uniref:Sugar phosphate transporter domain-containing protein n=1 Tax=Rhizochromulina marina TaxID=1034831 RepID=A0A7S2WVQ0_9STRA|mmetsp:Transcript_6320/g.18494  ORF Transcript_6320/g.18494 Transcript_6320/m.18494 type:complete len:341 (+) Transcript_6320:109-1131(+)|eukprot:CAMPEP_0118963378 /NCGR_PEP_ID=MMETSP1173-20130426/1302_1 /TAXON_ID=1034831 /ORGANISM="Rhizochromulina marina cf, Strain CCMP1243" /LENGTH=340 /DNA_ID=CAMNT_0006911701 /DNA_START=84 /DNA_END=1106 /DNA_ORIENTATION=-
MAGDEEAQLLEGSSRASGGQAAELQAEPPAQVKEIPAAQPLEGLVRAQGLTAFAIAGYAVCSSLMLVVNKVAVVYMPAPSLVLFSQLATSALSVWLAGQFGFVTVDKLEQGKVVSFLPVACAFLGAIFTNIKTLQYANVETFIVFRASTPIIVSVCDYLFLGRELPTASSWLSLFGLVGGASIYVLTDSSFHVTGYYWVCVWFCVFCFDQIYIKHAVDTVKMESNWGRVFYTNFLSCFPLMFTGAVGEFTEVAWTPASIAALSVSCLLGVGMSYFAFLCRKLVSAAAFTVIGNCCKIATVIINLCIWDRHANPTGIIALLCCLLCAYFYKQAPLRKPQPV